MPGFNIGGTGGENSPSNTTETRRKHRWIFETLASGAGPERQVLLLLKSAQRPKFILEEPVIHHNQEQAYFAGKQSWESITLTFYDAEQNPNTSEALWNWENKCADIPQANVATPTAYKKDSKLKMLNGTGGESGGETWNLFGCWPKEVNWGDLSYDDTEIATIEVIMRFDRAKRGG